MAADCRERGRILFSPSRFLKGLAAAFAAALFALSSAANPVERLTALVDGAATPSALTAALVARGEALRIAGRRGDALADLGRAVETAPSAAEQAYAKAALGVALAEAGRRDQAEGFLRAGMEAEGQPAVIAISAATLAGLIAADEVVETSAMREARLAEVAALAEMAERASLGAGPVIRSIVATSRARIALGAGDAATAKSMLANAYAATQGLGAEAAQPLLSIGDAALEAGAPDLAARAFADAARHDGRIAAEAALGAGAAALALDQPEKALNASDGAARYAILTGAEDIHFSADWLRAEALTRLGDARAARGAYELAFEGLRDFRARTPLGAPPVSSGRQFAPRRFQLEYIDFLFQSGRDAPALFKARELVEDLKLDEIDDYFAERCTPARGRSRPADALGGGTLVLYPIVFADRTEMIWTVGDRIGGFTVPVARDDLRKEITALRYQIDLRVGGIEPAAGKLYDLLIAPVETDLSAIKTIVVAPDGPLRALPFAVLWDGDGFVGGKYGLATILGLNLVDHGETSLAGASVLAAGAVKVDDDYALLPSVTLELAAIDDVFNAEILAEEDFLAEALAGEIARSPYNIVHIATHAEFGATPADNFILTKGGRWNVTQLEATMRARAVQTETPVSLLTLSACNTAADLGGPEAERAPLGLAGVGFRAGARSVLASLWPAEDVSTAELMAEFYKALNVGVGRAEALRQAQAKLIANPDTADPFQWANFLLIGDWR